jgi:hypothetical protein
MCSDYFLWLICQRTFFIFKILRITVLFPVLLLTFLLFSLVYVHLTCISRSTKIVPVTPQMFSSIIALHLHKHKYASFMLFYVVATNVIVFRKLFGSHHVTLASWCNKRGE